MPTAPRISSLAPGTVFAGDYRVIQPLSEGGMGAVYVAEQISTGKQRALKLMLPQLVADPKLRARFEQEARIGSKIDSEHVVEVVAAGIDPQSGVPWLAMELLRGEDLATYMHNHGPMSARAMVEVLEQVCHAVGAAHAAGVVHRDLKPENIFVAQARRTGSSFMIKVLDFGIAKVVAEAKTANTEAIGSPMWMAPEQTAHNSVIAAQTDVWSLGLIVFYLLTKRVFWRSADDDTATMGHMLREIAIDPIPLASQRAAEIGAAHLFPQGFDRWFASSVDRNIGSRFPNAHVQLAELQALFAPYMNLSHTPSAPHTQLQPPIYAALPPRGTTTGGLANQTAGGGGGISAWPFVLGGVVLLGIAGALVAFVVIGKDKIFGDSTAATVSDTTTPPPPPPSASVTSTKSLLNPWINVAAATGALKLGVADEKSPDPAFRQSRGIMAPTTAYEIQQHEVTWEEIEPYVIEHPDLAFVKPSWLPLAHDKYPATGVPWSTALSYCKSLKGSLPTEEQWEFAARGPDLRAQPWGSAQIDLARTVAFTGDPKTTMVLKVAMASDQDQTPGEDAVAINDMGGNALEWTIDLYRDDRPGQSEHWVEEGGFTYRAIRGVPVTGNPPKVLPAAATYRQSLCATGPCPADTSKVLQYVGFRCVRHAGQK